MHAFTINTYTPFVDGWDNPKNEGVINATQTTTNGATFLVASRQPEGRQTANVLLEFAEEELNRTTLGGATFDLPALCDGGDGDSNSSDGDLGSDSDQSNA